jgi:hypothetical protein
MYNDKRAQEELSKKNIERFFKRGTSGGLNISNESFVDRLGDPKD